MCAWFSGKTLEQLVGASGCVWLGLGPCGDSERTGTRARVNMGTKLRLPLTLVTPGGNE